MLSALLVLPALALAYANGANDNFKGVATLFGSRSAGYRTALALATVATALGSIASLALATGLIKIFSGAGVVPPEVAGSPRFAGAIALAASATVLLATRLGLPISTTHALTGGIVGAGLVLAGPELNFGALGRAFVAPLVLGPLLAIAVTFVAYALLHRIAERLGVTRETCVCVEGGTYAPLRPQAAAAAPAIMGQASLRFAVEAAPVQKCVEKYGGRLLGVRVQAVTDAAHYASAAAVSFARGLNDTPKIVALLLASQALGVSAGGVAVGAAMAIGGLLNARRVAVTMSERISSMNDGQALTANLVSAALVIFASRLGLPVSTTHVTVGAISGIGLANGSANRAVLAGVASAWVLTLPFATAAGALCAWLPVLSG